MSGLAKLNEKMKKKLSLGDYTLASPLAAPVPEVVAPPVVSTPVEVVAPPVVLPPVVVKEVEPSRPARKLYALSPDDGQKLHDIFKHRLQLNQVSSIAQIMSEAIYLLHSQEIRRTSNCDV